MYSNPKHVRDHEIKVRVDEATFNLIEAAAEFHRTQKAVLARELIEAGLSELKNADKQQVA